MDLKFRYSILCAFLILVGCAQKELSEMSGSGGTDRIPDEEEGLVEVSFTASTSSSFFDEGGKASLNGMKLVWEPGDEIAVSAQQSGATIYKFTTADGGASAVFTGKVPADFRKGKAFYPYSAVFQNSSGNNFRVEGIPALVQKAVRSGVGPGTVPLVTMFDDISDGLTFHHLSALIKVNVSGTDVTSIKLETTGADDDVKCRGALSLPPVSFANVGCGSLVFNCAYRGARCVTMVPSSGTAFTPGEYYFVIVATSDANPRTLRGLTITYTKADGSRWSRTSSNPLKVLPGRIYTLPGSESDCTKVPDGPQAAVVGQRIPAWTEGCFDIHFINTMAGECSFLIFPDGTQMLIDASGALQATGPVNSTQNNGIRVRWDPTKDSGYNNNTLIEEYVHNCMVWTDNEHIDYVLSSHFHGDHFGALSDASGSRDVSVRSGSYKQQSLAYMLDEFDVRMALDRGYPDYNYPCDLRKYSGGIKNWAAAVDWHVKNTGMTAEKVKAGSNTQVLLKRDKAAYPTFSVRNLSVNGDIWSGSGTGYVRTFPLLSEIECPNPPDGDAGDKCPAENHQSVAMKFTYGDFDYFSGGDLQYNGMSYFAWKDIETPVARACGAVDVMKADHHGTANTNGSGYKGTYGTAWAIGYLQPTCWIVNNWVDGQPRQATFEGVYKLCPSVNIWITNTCEAQTHYGGYSAAMRGADGNVVVRVMPGGRQYYVYTITDNDRKMTVKTVSGPYESK